MLKYAKIYFDEVSQNRSGQGL